MHLLANATQRRCTCPTNRYRLGKRIYTRWYIYWNKKFSNTLQIRKFITEIHVEIYTEFFTVNMITILFNTKYFMHWCKISFVWSAVPVIKCFQKDKMSIFWSSSTCIWDCSRRFCWILTYQRQFLDIMQSEFVVRNFSRIYVIWMKRSSSGVSFFFLPDLGRSPANFICTKRLFIR